jgi:hypothetical protein
MTCDVEAFTGSQPSISSYIRKTEWNLRTRPSQWDTITYEYGIWHLTAYSDNCDKNSDSIHAIYLPQGALPLYPIEIKLVYCSQQQKQPLLPYI